MKKFKIPNFYANLIDPFNPKHVFRVLTDPAGVVTVSSQAEDFFIRMFPNAVFVEFEFDHIVNTSTFTPRPVFGAPLPRPQNIIEGYDITLRIRGDEEFNKKASLFFQEAYSLWEKIIKNK